MVTTTTEEIIITAKVVITTMEEEIITTVKEVKDKEEIAQEVKVEIVKVVETLEVETTVDQEFLK